MKNNEIRKDDRLPGEIYDYRFAVVGIDDFMSYWGDAEGMLSWAAWACKEVDIDKVLKNVKNRGDIRRIKVVEIGKFFRKGHMHIYVCRHGHRYLK